MNHDRLLTRVFDKKQNKMFYPNDQDFHVYDCHKFYRKDYDFSYEDAFLGITGEYLFFSKHGHEGKGERTCDIYCVDIVNTPEKDDYRYSDYKCCIEDRFIPLLCTAHKDKNQKLIYGADIVVTSNNKYLVYWEEESAAFWFKRLDNECELLIDDFSCEIEIIGNRFEQPKFLEVKA